MADRWLNEYIRIELNKQRPKSILGRILSEGYVKVNMDLRHFDVYQKGDRRLLYSPSENIIDMIYNVKKVFGGIETSSFSSIDFEFGGGE